MLNKKEKDLESLTKEIEELKKERNLRKTELEENPCKGNEDSYYLSEINLNELLVKKTKIILNDCYQKLNFSLGNILGYSISRFVRGYGKLMSITEKELEKYSNGLENFQKKFYNPLSKSEKQSIDSV